MELNHFIKADLENSVLSSFIFQADDFFSFETHDGLFTEHRLVVYHEIKRLLNSGITPDLVALTNNLTGKVSARDLVYIAESPLSVNTEYYIEQLEKARLRREMHQTFTKAAEMCRNGSEPTEITTLVNSRISNAETHRTVDSMKLSFETMELIEKEVMGGVEAGIKTGIRRLDSTLNGFLKNELVILAARPGMGKTSLALNMARNFGFSGYPGVIFSLEMQNVQLMKRMICDIASIDGSFLFGGKLTNTDTPAWVAIHEASEKISGMPIQWDDTARLSIDKLFSRAMRAKSVHGIRWIIVDYLQLIQGWGTPGMEAKAEITRQLKLLAKEIEVTVIVLSQLNRGIESRKERAPMMSDLRDCGSIEQDADICIFPDVPVKSKNGTSGIEYDPASLYLVKTRRGRTGVINGLKWQGHYFRYSD